MLRTPDSRFADLPGWPSTPQYAQPLGADGPRMAVVDEGPRDAAVTVLCLHGNPSWGWLYRHMLPVFLGAGLRVVVPDLIGFGRSDKPADEAWHTFDRHRQSLLNLIEQLDLRNVMLVCQDWGGIFGLTLPMAAPDRFTRLLVMNTTLATGELTEGFKAWRAYSNSQPDMAVGKLLQRGKCDMSATEAAGYDAPFAVGSPAHLTLVDPAGHRTFGTDALHGKGVNSPYLGRELPGRVVATLHAGVPTVLDGELRDASEVSRG